MHFFFDSAQIRKSSWFSCDLLRNQCCHISFPTRSLYYDFLMGQGNQKWANNIYNWVIQLWATFEYYITKGRHFCLKLKYYLVIFLLKIEKKSLFSWIWSKKLAKSGLTKLRGNQPKTPKTCLKCVLDKDRFKVFR